ncbi:PIG-L family deacetylase [Paradesertivirga mongoliensis]|uniref:PIG-L family deacetylase n=1 Tax=Paradesertivirga mongoliensis TaxID=2100740 RepID=A0ABW4ZQ58_9SPHI|nr:PIG-L family deacetylase [Pedobacter mongoliensis]
MNSRRYYVFLLLLLSFSVKAQEFNQLNSSEIRLGLQKLNVVGSVLYIAAHPDDENTRLLAYLAKEKKLRTGYLSITRGDGGQNLIGTEQAELLGLIRTQELLAARKVDGAEQFFTRANDFGFSKSPEESLKFWGKEQILEDVVWVIRNFKPDVIITRFPEDERAGHGQHSASAILAREAFIAAADSKRFPDQLKQVKTWQAKRIVWNTFNFGGTNTTASDQLTINVGLYNPLLGKSYGEIAAESRTNHKSQGFGSASQRGDFMEFFRHVAGSKAKTDLFEGLDFSWGKLPDGKEISTLIKAAENIFDATQPSKSVESLLKIKRLIDQTEEQQKSEEINKLILACAGIWFEMTSNEPYYAAGDSIAVKLQAIARVPTDFKYDVSINETLSKQTGLKLSPNKITTVNPLVKFETLSNTQPYWLRLPQSIGSYSLTNTNENGMPENKDPFSAIFNVQIGDQKITVKRPVVYKYTDQVRGEVYQHLVVAPPVTASLTEKAYVFNHNTPQKISVQLQSFRDNIAGRAEVQVPAGWSVTPKTVDFTLQKKGGFEVKEFTITPGGNVSNGNMTVNIRVGNQTFNQGFKEIKYDHIPAQSLFPKAQAQVARLDIKTTGKKVAYIAGAGDLVGESLKLIGYDVTNLSAEQVLSTDLSAFDAIVTGVRLYNTNPDVKAMQPKLLDYVFKGGVLLLQYNVSNPLLIQNMGPYPFRLNRDRVTQEDAEVRLINPEHPVLNFPNKITARDFEGWIQERGLYFATEADAAYTPILSTNDTGEKPNTGSLLVANHGKGKFVYTSLSFFRQLPAGVPGAYRLFVNLISKQK